MKYEVYADSLFILYFCQNFCLLYLTGKAAGKREKLKRVFAGALILSGSSLFFLLLPRPETVPVFLWAAVKKILSTAAGLTIPGKVFRARGKEGWIRILTWYCGNAIFLGGGLELCGRIFLERKYGYKEQIFFTVILTLAASLFLSWQNKRKERVLLQVCVEDGGKKISIPALLDSGNSLYEPLSGEPVCIMEKSLFDEIWGNPRAEQFRIVPFHSIGKEHGLLKAVTVEQVEIRKEEQEWVRKRAVVALYEGKLSVSGQYHMILHPALLKN